MKFKLEYRERDNPKNVQWEEYEEPIDDAQKWAVETIKRFNETLRPGESARDLIQVVVLDADSNEKHSWGKTNLTTIIDRLGNYDTMKCAKCGITGKRFGLGRGGVKIDSKYRAKKFQRCDTAMGKV